MIKKTTPLLACLALLGLASVAHGYRTRHYSIREYARSDWTFRSGGLYPIEEDGKLGFIDSTGRIVVKPIYDDAGEFCDGRAYVMQDGKYGFVDSTGRVIVPPRYDTVGAFCEGLALVVQNGKAGYIDETGKVVIAPQFESANDFSESLAPVRSRGKWGYIDRTGQFAIGPKYAAALCFECGMGMVDSGVMSYEIIDRTGKLIFEPKCRFLPMVVGQCAEFETWDSKGQFTALFNREENKQSEYRLDQTAQYSNGTLLIHDGSGFRFIDSLGNTVIAGVFDGARKFYSGRAAVAKGCGADANDPYKFIGGKWGYIDRSGKVVIDLKYDQAYNYDHGVAEVIQGGRISFIDTLGKTVTVVDSMVSQVDSVVYGIPWFGWFHNGLAPARVGGTPDSSGRLHGGKWGYIGRAGKLIIEPQYDLARGFHYGRAVVASGGKFGYIDTTGKVIVEPTLKEARDFSGNLARVETEQSTAYIDRSGKVVWQRKENGHD
jgi:hypothetical protein